MTRTFNMTLAQEIARLYVHSCKERELEVAELLLQALEALARRGRDDSMLDAAILQSLQALAANDMH